VSLRPRIIGIDYGSRRIGIAVSDPLGIIATGVATIPNDPRLFERIREFVGKYDARMIVVGAPLNLKGENAAAGSAASEFAGRLTKELGLPVEMVDERFTSVRAHQTLREMGVRKKERQSKERIDAMAAALILQSYLDSAAPAHRDEREGTEQQ
jgi:putative holliday junction resolvase